MANIIEITDLNAPELDAYARLTEAQLKSKKQPGQAMFIAESLTVIGHALNAGYKPVSFLMERRQIEGQAAEIIENHPDVPVYTADREVLASLTGYELTRGVLCAMRRPVIPEAEAVIANARRIAVLEGIVDPTNVGSIFRNAAALGMDAVLLSPTCCDALHRRAVRVSMGTVFQIPWARIGEKASDWPEEGIERLKRAGFRLAALALDDRSVSVDNSGLMEEERLALILGTEGHGLMDETIRACDYTVKIPMHHGADSLNVASASAVAFWQLRVK
ncbi:MAG: RNA methyltransferase [Clostridia bacterium]|nr:RNA methyltransferase [Clostridia bacterium]